MPRRLGPVAVLLLLLAVATALRLWGIRYGFPHPSARPDEREVLLATRTFPAGDLNPHYFVYPSLYLYLVWLWGEAALAMQRLGSTVVSWARLLDADLPALILPGRLLSAIGGIATVALSWAAGCSVAGPAAGLVAAAIVATNPVDVRDSHALKPDTLLSLGVLASLWLLARWSERPSMRRALLAGLAIGVTTGIKYNGVFLLVSAWLAHAFLRPDRGIGWRRLLPDRMLWAIGGVTVAVFTLGTPYMVLDPRAFFGITHFVLVAEYATRPWAKSQGGAIDAILTFFRTRAFGYHLGVSLWHGCGAAVALATPFALASALRRRTSPLLVLAASFVVFYYLVLGASPVQLARYFTPLVPLVALCIGALVAAGTSRLGRTARTAAVAAAMLVLCVQPLASSLAHVRLMARPDTRVLALEWMRAHLPRGAIAAVLGSPIPGYPDPILPAGVTRLDWRVPVEQWPASGVTNVVTHEHPLPFSRPNPDVMRALDGRLRLLAEFSPFRGAPAGGFEEQDAYYVPLWDHAAVVRGGPVVRVYAFQP